MASGQTRYKSRQNYGLHLSHFHCSDTKSVVVLRPCLFKTGPHLLQGREYSRLALLSKPVAFAPDVLGLAVVEQPVQDGGGDNHVS